MGLHLVVLAVLTRIGGLVELENVCYRPGVVLWQSTQLVADCVENLSALGLAQPGSDRELGS